ncbi:hypothetical protein [Paenibacillus terrigena]|uniref:hypothetical protein n=1 Tax=Paenibacillus terrigena TaxID=369333 RepID=UPI0028D41DED|nr:hypothetical protein [Paenibacillus terrigena]
MNIYTFEADFRELNKCSVAVHEDMNQVGTLSADGSVKLDYDKIAFWTTSGEERDEKRPCSYEKRQIKKTLQAIWEAPFLRLRMVNL